MTTTRTRSGTLGGVDDEWRKIDLLDSVERYLTQVLRSAMRRSGYVPMRRAGDIQEQLSESLMDELERALTRIMEYESNAEESGRADGRVARIVQYLQKQAYLTGAATRRADWGENLVLVVLRRTGTEDCARYVGRVFVDDVYSSGEMYQTPRGYSSWHAVTERFMRRASYPPLSTAIEGGLYHYGCKCWHISYFEGVTSTDYQGERLPSFVSSDPSSDGNLDDEDALYAVRSHLRACLISFCHCIGESDFPPF